MSISQDRVPLPGSERAPLSGARPVGAPDPGEEIAVTVLVRPRQSSEAPISVEAMGARPPGERQYLRREEFEALRGADPNDVRKVEAFAHTHSLTVVGSSAARRSVALSGRVTAFNAAFGVNLECYEYPGGTYRGRTGPVHVPAELAPIVLGVFGLDDRPQASPHFRCLADGGSQPPAGQGTAFTPLQIAQVYGFPTGVNGQGQTIAIIELSGGFTTGDLTAYFTELGISAPQIVTVSVDGSQNQPIGNPDSCDGEVMLDMEIAGAVAPGTSIVVYFAPNTSRGLFDAVTTAIHDGQNKPSVISISWGAVEQASTLQTMQAIDQAFQDAATLGVTVCCSSGDSGSSAGQDDGLAHVSFPASSPFALACGGTRLDVSNGAFADEVVWNENGATGGGVSDVFPLPNWQVGAQVPPSVNPGGRVGRGVPDVAGHADPSSGYHIRVDGVDRIVGGTSAVAPLWAGLIALMNQSLGQPAGYLNPLLYNVSPKDGIFRDITSGNNGAYQACLGWNACTGLGSPMGVGLLMALNTHKLGL